MSEHSVRDRNRFDVEVEVTGLDLETGRVEYHIHIDMLERALQMEQAAPLAVIPDVAAYVASRRPVIAAALLSTCGSAPTAARPRSRFSAPRRRSGTPT